MALDPFRQITSFLRSVGFAICRNNRNNRIANPVERYGTGQLNGAGRLNDIAPRVREVKMHDSE